MELCYHVHFAGEEIEIWGSNLFTVTPRQTWNSNPGCLTQPVPLNNIILSQCSSRKFNKEMGKPDHLTCLLRNLFVGQEATVRTGHGTMDWFQIGKGVHQSCILSPCLFNFYAEYIMRNAGLDEAQAGIKIARRNINNLRYADDITLISSV